MKILIENDNGKQVSVSPDRLTINGTTIGEHLKKLSKLESEFKKLKVTQNKEIENYKKKLDEDFAKSKKKAEQTAEIYKNLWGKIK